MKENLKNIENKPTKGISIEECVKKADSFIKKNGACLFLFDIKGSKKYSAENRQKLQHQLIDMIASINTEFDQYFPKNNLATFVEEEKGFHSLLGDGSWVGINNSAVIPQIVDYIKENYSNIEFHFNVAKDGFDEEALKTVK
ncbi:MAG: hypothetical protein PHE32_03645 [Candidatus Shapirobacteria bacterium]|nr:hypothetical protein [Candidatus Shapirobacteria bacterium]MDD4410768.1 hypothetical protein [Candidatus Shapirobacteria bacterium]